MSSAALTTTTAAPSFKRDVESTTLIDTTASTHRVSCTTGVHLLKVTGHSLIKSANMAIHSNPFRVGGHDWRLGRRVLSYGDKEAGEEYT
jgi:hypothetical protein